MRSPEVIKSEIDGNLLSYKDGKIPQCEYEEKRDDLIREYVTSSRNYQAGDTNEG